MDPLCIVVDYCDGGSLHSYLRTNATISESQMLKFVREIVRGIYKLKLIKNKNKY